MPLIVGGEFAGGGVGGGGLGGGEETGGGELTGGVGAELELDEDVLEPDDDEPELVDEVLELEDVARESEGGCDAAVGGDVPVAAGEPEPLVSLPHALNAASDSTQSPICPSASARLFRYESIRPPRFLASDEAKRIRTRKEPRKDSW